MSIKRIDLMLEAMSKVNEELSLKIVGSSDEPAIENYLKLDLISRKSA